jgi:hypothetical protein
MVVKKVIIIHHERGGSHVMDHDGCFWFVKGYTSQPIGAEIEFAPKKSLSQYAKTATIAACLVLAMFLGSFSWMWNAENYYVSVDINPSVELVFNGFNQLKRAKPLNEAGTTLIRDVDFKGSPENVLLYLIESAQLKGYITRESATPVISITITANAGKDSKAYSALIENVLEKNQLHSLVVVGICDMEFRSKAIELGVSPGKLKLAEQLYAKDQTVGLAELVNIPVQELMKSVRETEENGIPNNGWTEHEVPGNNGSGNGIQPVTNPNQGPGNNSGNNEPKEPNPNQGPGNNSGNNEPKEPNPNQGPGNNSGNNDPNEPNTNQGSENSTNSVTPEEPEQNPDPGMGSSNIEQPKEPNTNPDPGNNTGNNAPKEPNPNQGSGNNSGNNEPGGHNSSQDSGDNSVPE